MSDTNVYRWSFIDRTSIALINFGVNIALVRMLTAADFGLLAMIAIFTAIAQDLSGCGLSDGLIHKAKPTPTDFSTVFIFNAGMGLIFGLAFFFGAPIVAAVFRHSELILVMRCLGVCFFFQSMSYVQETRMRKMLKMKTVCIVRVSATLTVSAMGIVAAYLGMGYKALICTQIFLSFFFFLYYTIASRWFPRPRFCRRSFKELFGYGVHLMLAYLSTLIGKNINTSVLGRSFTSAMSGLYYQGAKLANVPFNIIEYSVNSPFFVIASNEQNFDNRIKLFAGMFVHMVFICGSLGLFLVTMADPVIRFIYGEKWIDAIPVFRILVCAEALICMRAFFQTVCKVHGRTVFIRNMGFAEIALQLTLLACFYRKGINWIAWTQVAGVAGALVVYVCYTRRYFALRIRTLAARAVAALWLPALAAVVTVVALYLLGSETAPLWRCMAGAAAYVASFAAVGELSRDKRYILLRNKLLHRNVGQKDTL